MSFAIHQCIITICKRSSQEFNYCDIFIRPNIGLTRYKLVLL